MSNSYEALICVCENVLEGKENLIEGCRKIVEIRNQLNLAGDLTFSQIVGFVSETDEFPDANIRSNFSQKYLDKSDLEFDEYARLIRPAVIESCRKLLFKYKNLQ